MVCASVVQNVLVMHSYFLGTDWVLGLFGGKTDCQKHWHPISTTCQLLTGSLFHSKSLQLKIRWKNSGTQKLNDPPPKFFLNKIKLK